MLAALLATASILDLPVSAAAPASEPVRLEIANVKSPSVLRCQLVLAHFVTLALERIGPESRAIIQLQRDMQAGTLFYPRADGRPMALENVFCGLDDDWQANRVDLDLQPLRGGEGELLLIVCDGGRGLACASNKLSAE